MSLSSVAAAGSRPQFTAAQWLELEHQALIFKYLAAGVPLPLDLLVPVRSSFDAVPTPYYHHSSLGYHAYYGKKLDPEPWRCRRTDGKKWRCSKEAYPDSKYCERHMHRGRNRSRKLVESKILSLSQPSAPGVTPLPPGGGSTSRSDSGTFQTISLPSLAASNYTQDLALGGSSSSQLHTGLSAYGNKYLGGDEVDAGAYSFFSEASGSARALCTDSPVNNSWRLMSSCMPSFSSSRLAPVQELGQVTIASLSQEQQQQHYSFFGSELISAEPAKHENQELRPSLGEWPKTRELWSDMDGRERSNPTSFSTTELSISIPMASSRSPDDD